MAAVPDRLLVLGSGPVGVEMAQAARNLGAQVTLIGRADRVLEREAAPLGEALGGVLRRGGVDLVLGAQVSAARREGEDFVLELGDGRELRGDRLLVATGRRPRVEGLGLETVGIEAGPHGIAVDSQLRAGAGLWAIGDVTGIWPLTSTGKYQADVAAGNILGRFRSADYTAVPRVVFTDPQVAVVGADDGRYTATVALSDVARTATWTRRYADQIGFLTLFSDGELVTGAQAVGPEAGEWLQQATLAIRARVPLDVLRDVVQPFPTFSEVYAATLDALDARIAAGRSRTATPSKAELPAAGGEPVVMTPVG
jgi:dihydrolipoamide dehydrogenase